MKLCNVFWRSMSTLPNPSFPKCWVLQNNFEVMIRKKKVGLCTLDFLPSSFLWYQQKRFQCGSFNMVESQGCVPVLPTKHSGMWHSATWPLMWVAGWHNQKPCPGHSPYCPAASCLQQIQDPLQMMKWAVDIRSLGTTELHLSWIELGHGNSHGLFFLNFNWF